MPFIFMPDTIDALEVSPLLLFGLLLLGGLASGEASRRILNFPRTTGYVLFGVLIGNSGLHWVDPYILDSARFFIYPGIGLILFELGHRFPLARRGIDRNLLLLSLAETGTVFLLVTTAMYLMGFGIAGGLFAAAIAASTSPAITIATCGDVDAQGPSTQRLFGLVALNACVAFAAVGVVVPMLAASGAIETAPGYAAAAAHVLLSVLLGAGLALLACQAARLLGRQVEHQHLMLLGLIVVGTGLPLSLDISPLLTLLTFGILTRVVDRRNEIVAIRIGSDARVFLVVTFVLAGAALEVELLAAHWPAAVLYALVRFVARWAALFAVGRWLGMDARASRFTAIGLLPMSSVALVLLGDAGPLDDGIGPALSGTLMGAIVLMQLLGPLCTQTAIVGFGEAQRYAPRTLRQPGGAEAP